MKTQWYKGLEDDAKQEMIDHYNSSGLLRERLTSIVQDKIDARERESMTLGGYECTNWGFKQADCHGYKRALKEIQSLLD